MAKAMYEYANQLYIFALILVLLINKVIKFF